MEEDNENENKPAKSVTIGDLTERVIYENPHFDEEMTEDSEEARGIWGQGENIETFKDSIVLYPDHPLLDKFQKTLKEHLTRLIAKFKEEVFQAEKDFEYADQVFIGTGVEIYKVQQRICLQEKEVGKIAETLEEGYVHRSHLSDKRASLQDNYTKLQQETQELTRKESNLRAERDSLNLLCSQMTKWESDMSSEMTINQRMNDKTIKEKHQLMKEKRMQDLKIYKLMDDIWKNEAEIVTIDKELEFYEEKRGELDRITEEGEIDLEALEEQQKDILTSWHNTLVSVKIRDREYYEIMLKVKDVKEIVLEFDTELSITEKEIKNAMEMSEDMESQATYIKLNLSSEDRLLIAEGECYIIIEDKLREVQEARDAVKEDYTILHLENVEIREEIKEMREEIKAGYSQKLHLEEDLTRTIFLRSVVNKDYKHHLNIMRRLKRTIHELEYEYFRKEHQGGKMLRKSEHLRGRFIVYKIHIKRLKNRENIQSDKNDYVKLRIKGRDAEGEVYQRLLAKASQRFSQLMSEALMQEPDAKTVISRMVLENKDTAMYILKSISYWTRLQDDMLTLNKRFAIISRELLIHQKTYLLLEKRQFHCDDSLAVTIEKDKVETIKLIDLKEFYLECKIELKENRKLRKIKKRAKKAGRKRGKLTIRTAEVERLRVMKGIALLKQERQEITKQMYDTDQDILVWDQNLRILRQTQELVAKEKSDAGDMGEMKAEINRMNIRFGQLVKAQEKLSEDLEQCITRRDTMLGVAEALEKRSTTGPDIIRANYLRKLADKNAKINKVFSDIKDYENRYNDMCNEEIRSINEIQEKRDKLELFTKLSEESKRNVENKKLEKYKNLEQLVHKQRRIRVYNDITKGKYKSRFKGRINLEAEHHKLRILNTQLYNIITALLSNHPAHYVALQRAINTLKNY